MTTPQAQTEMRALRMLRAGDSWKEIQSATGYTQDQQRQLLRDNPASIPMRPTPTVPAPTAPTMATPEPGTSTTGTAPLTIARLLEEASVHSHGRIRRLGETIENKLLLLRTAIAEEAEAERQHQAEAAERAAAKAEITRLEEQLRVARAKAKPPTKPAATGRKYNWSPEQRAAAADRLRAANALRYAAKQAQQ
jgi:hypothetical protein